MYLQIIVLKNMVSSKLFGINIIKPGKLTVIDQSRCLILFLSHALHNSVTSQSLLGTFQYGMRIIYAVVNPNKTI